MFAKLLIASLLILGIGCGKEPKSSTSSTAAAPTNAAANAPASAANVDALLQELTQLIRKCAAEHRFAPKSLEEVVQKGCLTQIPPAPAGKRFAINKNLEVYLADR